MTTPTKDQIAAAKAFLRERETEQQYALLCDESPPKFAIERSAEILLAALEAAEGELKATMQAGGYEHFAAQVRNANQQAHNAIYVAQQLEKKLEAAEADSARLDWLEAKQFCLMAMAPHSPDGGGVWWTVMTGHGDHNADTARDAIDAARKEAQP